MEVDQPATESEKHKEQAPSTSQDQTNQCVNLEQMSEDAWLAGPGLSLEGLPEITYDRPFFTPATSPDRS